MVDFTWRVHGKLGPIEGGSIGLSIGRTYGSMGWASLFMPALLGIIADKYFSAQKF
jgi:NHS family xanthosine MFS transporter